MPYETGPDRMREARAGLLEKQALAVEAALARPPLEAEPAVSSQLEVVQNYFGLAAALGAVLVLFGDTDAGTLANEAAISAPVWGVVHVFSARALIPRGEIPEVPTETTVVPPAPPSRWDQLGALALLGGFLALVAGATLLLGLGIHHTVGVLLGQSVGALVLVAFAAGWERRNALQLLISTGEEDDRLFSRPRPRPNVDHWLL
ncbi:MAG: hypothetical protein JWO02_3901 [Solirubrobacterales bacterium]|nr:hypothetical protein [Solirubrobacterales bacterium]